MAAERFKEWIWDWPLGMKTGQRRKGEGDFAENSKYGK
jgi:hypothetical protein